MILKDFIKQFSHNNEIWVENRDNYCMCYRHYPGDPILHDGIVMDWELPHTDIADCDVIRIANVIHESKTPAITIVIDTGLGEFTFLPERTTMENAPLWLYDRTHRTKTIAGEVCE